MCVYIYVYSVLDRANETKTKRERYTRPRAILRGYEMCTGIKLLCRRRIHSIVLYCTQRPGFDVRGLYDKCPILITVGNTDTECQCFEVIS